MISVFKKMTRTVRHGCQIITTFFMLSITQWCLADGGVIPTPGGGGDITGGGKDSLDMTQYYIQKGLLIGVYAVMIFSLIAAAIFMLNILIEYRREGDGSALKTKLLHTAIVECLVMALLYLAQNLMLKWMGQT